MSRSPTLNGNIEFLMVKECAEILRLHPETVYLLLKNKKNGIPKRRIGRVWRIPKDEFMEWARNFRREY